ncbi:HTTM domain-containing protein [Fuerstiella marisgermanici]|uniref:Vitamin K-dependent gamma-carboxylase n=1 Tax=Fuerstiella marisgermanici TaxID=1891926 RepID=A0A1P8WFK5_9PLAN|nr:HTTM domain-containing protein [Fuerstiella marisgermanici]APZ92858.1 Vitamin K-dependent gamma-carboxylase [Fuerstiella marisgermanici]
MMAGTTTDVVGLAKDRPTVLSRLFRPVDIASLVFIRIAFGTILLWHLRELFQSGAIDALYDSDQFHFRYLGFNWVHPWPEPGMRLHFAALSVLAACIVLGLFYRYAALLFCVGFTYVLLLDRTAYHNHYYLIILLSGILAVVPAHGSFSLDVCWRPKLRLSVVPVWMLWLVRFQVGIVYVYSGFAKLEQDWIIRLQPVRLLLARETDFPILGAFFREEWMIALFSYGGLAFDLLIIPLLLWRPTRTFAFLVAIGFHLLNVLLFDIGIFPWLMIALTTIFFEPSWPRRFLFWQAAAKRCKGVPNGLANPTAETNFAGQWWTLAFLAVYVTTQLLIPLRHHLYPGNPNWTEEGQNFSWRLMHRVKACRDVVFVASSPAAQRTWHIRPPTSLTEKQVIRMSGHPDLILEFSHFLANEMRAAGYEDVQIRALTSVSLNGREQQPLLAPDTDLAMQHRSWRHQPWILPLEP